MLVYFIDPQTPIYWRFTCNELMCVVKCCTIHGVSNAMDCVDSVVHCFSNSPKHQFFEKCVEKEHEGNPQCGLRKKLKELCHTRRVDCHYVLEVFVYMYKALITCLGGIAWHWSRGTCQDANSLLHSLCFPLLVALMLTREVLFMTKGLSVKLQGTYVNIVRAHKGRTGQKWMSFTSVFTLQLYLWLASATYT